MRNWHDNTSRMHMRGRALTTQRDLCSILSLSAALLLITILIGATGRSSSGYA